MALGIGLIIIEFFMPTYGSLGVGGLAAFVIGSIILFGHAGNARRTRGHSRDQLALQLSALS